MVILPCGANSSAKVFLACSSNNTIGLSGRFVRKRAVSVIGGAGCIHRHLRPDTI